MTKVDIFSGFLGAGKTTLIKKLIEEGAYANETLVLIENEFGQIGIDGGFLKDTGVQINEMTSGCICCTLVGDFGKALNQVIQEYHPQRILIEPSGVGKLSDVIQAVQDLQNEELVLNTFTTVVDAKKAKVYLKNFGEFYKNQVENAGSIVLSHTAGLAEEKLKLAVELVRGLNSTASLITTDWDQLTGVQLLQAMEADPSLSAELDKLREEAQEHHHHHHHEEGHCCCGHHHEEHEHHHHDHEDHECCGHHDHHDHEHHHHEDGHCCCGHHHGEGHHHADEVFSDLGVETARKYTKEELEEALEELDDIGACGMVLRSKGIVEGAEGNWLHFDYVPGEPEVREGAAAATGMICVIGVDLKEDHIRQLFHL